METKPIESPEFWPFPAKLPIPLSNIPVPKFNPENIEDALL